jgi:hypothetical protein
MPTTGSRAATRSSSSITRGRKVPAMELCIEVVGNRVSVKQYGKETLSAPLSDFLATLVEHRDHFACPRPFPKACASSTVAPTRSCLSSRKSPRCEPYAGSQMIRRSPLGPLPHSATGLPVCGLDYRIAERAADRLPGMFLPYLSIAVSFGPALFPQSVQCGPVARAALLAMPGQLRPLTAELGREDPDHPKPPLGWGDSINRARSTRG